MTVPANLNRVDYTGTGSAGPFTVPFPFYDTSHLTVLQTDALFNQTTLTGWTATGAGGPSGAVTLAAACPVGSTLTIMRLVPLTQITSIKNQEAFYPEVHEQEMDLLAMADQQLDEAMDRTLRLPAGLSGVDMTLPKPDPGHALVWNAAGDGLENAGVASATLQQDLADSADVAKGDAMMAVKQPFAGAVARTQHDKNAEWVSVLDFGADPTGLLDSSHAFQNALNECAGRIIYIPKGEYKIEKTITSYNISGQFHPGVRFWGAGRGVSVLNNKVANGYAFDFDHRNGSTNYNNQVFSNGSFLKGITLKGDASVPVSSGIRFMGLYDLRIEQCIISNHTNYGLHGDCDLSYNPDISASPRLFISNSSIAYNKIGVYAPIAQAIPTALFQCVNIDWNTDAGLILCSNYVAIQNGSISFNGYSYTGDFSPSADFGGLIIPDTSGGTAASVSINRVEIDGNHPQHVFACSSSLLNISNCKIGVRIKGSETKKYQFVFGKAAPYTIFRCNYPIFENNSITVNDGNYSVFTEKIMFRFGAGSRGGFIGVNQWYFGNGVIGWDDANLRMISEETRVGEDGNPIHGIRFAQQATYVGNRYYDVAVRDAIYTSISDDAAISFKPRRDKGILVLTGGSSYINGIIGYVASTGVTYKIAGGIGVEVGPTNTALNGTTGTDTRVTVGSKDGLLYIENRSGGSLEITTQTIGTPSIFLNN